MTRPLVSDSSEFEYLQRIRTILDLVEHLGLDLVLVLVVVARVPPRDLRLFPRECGDLLVGIGKAEVHHDLSPFQTPAMPSRTESERALRYHISIG